MIASLVWLAVQSLDVCSMRAVRANAAKVILLVQLAVILDLVLLQSRIRQYLASILRLLCLFLLLLSLRSFLLLSFLLQSHSLLVSLLLLETVHDLGKHEIHGEEGTEDDEEAEEHHGDVRVVRIHVVVHHARPPFQS